MVKQTNRRQHYWVTGILLVFFMLVGVLVMDNDNVTIAAPTWAMAVTSNITSGTESIGGVKIARPGNIVTWRHMAWNTSNRFSTSDSGQWVSTRYENTDEVWNPWYDGTNENNSGLIRIYDTIFNDDDIYRCIDIFEMRVANGTRAQIYSCGGLAAQHFIIPNGFNNIGPIINTNSNKCLDVDDGSTTLGARVQIWKCDSSADAQKWQYKESTGQIFYRGENYRNSINQQLCLDVKDGNIEGLEIPLQIWECNNSPAQKFIMDNAARTKDWPEWWGHNQPLYYGFYESSNDPGTTGMETLQAFGPGEIRRFTSSYTVTMDDVGSYRCRRTTSIPAAFDENVAYDSETDCAIIPYHYPGMCDDTKEPCGSLTPDCTQDGGCDGTILKSGVSSESGIQPKTNTSQTSIKPGETANFTYNLSDAGPTKSLDLEYRAYAFILKSGSSIDGESLSNSQVYASFSAAACGGRGVASSDQRYCQNSIVSGTGIVIGSGAGAYPNLNTSYQVNSSSISTSNANWAVEPGDKVCSYLVVDKWSVNNDKAAVTVAASNISCVTVNRNPQLQIRGSDSWAGGTWTDVDGTEQTTSGGFAGRAQASDQRGSWSQYGLFVYQGSTSGFGSAGSTMKSSGLNTEACKLIFANTSCPTSTGAFYTSSSLTQNIQLPALAYSNNLKAKANNAADSSIKVLSTVSNKIDLASLTSGTYWVNNSDTNNILMATGSLKNGVNATIYIDGILEIQNNITTESTSFTELADVPSLTVVAKNIRVTSNVTYIYGTYIARDTFYSAYSATGTQSELLKDQGTYNSQLKIDGALTSRYSPRFLRTLGGGSTTSSTTVNGETHLNSMTASEIINYLPTTFLVPATSGSSGTTWITTKQTVLPARY